MLHTFDLFVGFGKEKKVLQENPQRIVNNCNSSYHTIWRGGCSSLSGMGLQQYSLHDVIINKNTSVVSTSISAHVIDPVLCLPQLRNHGLLKIQYIFH